MTGGALVWIVLAATFCTQVLLGFTGRLEAAYAVGVATQLGFAFWDGWPGALFNVASAAFIAWLWWRGPGKRRRKAAAALGHKARAALAGMAGRLRDAGTPRPALIPVPGGAR